jgi:hypothetical protein
MARDVLALKPEEFATLPVVKAYWGCDCRDYDIWLSARNRNSDGLLWIFECPHGRWLLIGAPATVHGPWKKKWNQGVIKLPPEHKECAYWFYTQPEWYIVDDDPLRHFSSGSIKYKAVRWYGGDIDIYLKAQYPTYEAKLFITLERKIAHVMFDFMCLKRYQFELFLEPFEVDYEKAVQLFSYLFENGLLVKEDLPDEGLYSSLITADVALCAFNK